MLLGVNLAFTITLVISAVTGLHINNAVERSQVAEHEPLHELVQTKASNAARTLAVAHNVKDAVKTAVKNRAQRVLRKATEATAKATQAAKAAKAVVLSHSKRGKEAQFLSRIADLERKRQVDAEAAKAAAAAGTASIVQKTAAASSMFLFVLVVAWAFLPFTNRQCRPLKDDHTPMKPSKSTPREMGMMGMIGIATPVCGLWVLSIWLMVLAYQGWRIPLVFIVGAVCVELAHRCIHAVWTRQGKLVGADSCFHNYAKTMLTVPEVSQSKDRMIMVVGTSKLIFDTEKEAIALCDTWKSKVKKNCDLGRDFTMYVKDARVVRSSNAKQAYSDTLHEEKPKDWVDIKMSDKAHVLRLWRCGKTVEVQCCIRHDVVDGYKTLCLFAECMNAPVPEFELPKSFVMAVRMLDVNPLMYLLSPLFLAQFLNPYATLKDIPSPPHISGHIRKQDLQPLADSLGTSPAVLLQCTLAHLCAKQLGRGVTVGLIGRMTGILQGTNNTLCGVNMWISNDDDLKEVCTKHAALKTNMLTMMQMASSVFLMNRSHIGSALGRPSPKCSDNIDVALSYSIFCRDDLPVCKAYHAFRQDLFLRRKLRISLQLVGDRFLVDLAFDPEYISYDAFHDSIMGSFPEFKTCEI